MSNIEYAPAPRTPALAVAAERDFVTRTCAWMAVGLGFTAAIALILGHNETFQDALSGPIFLGLIVAELALVVYLSARVNRMTGTTATALFLAYAGLNGVTLSAILSAYTDASAGVAFVVCGSMFTVMAALGWVAKMDLTRLGS